MKSAVFDTCIVIDYARGIEQARDVIRACPFRMISTITWIEFLVGVPLERAAQAEAFLKENFDILPLDTSVAKEALIIRKNYRMKLPDAMIYGTAKSAGVPLVSRNIRDFKPDWPDVRIPYQL